MDISSILNKTEEIAKGITAAESVNADRNAIWVSQTMAALQQSRLTALCVPASYGGHGQGLYALVRVCEVLGREYSSAGLCFGMHSVGTAVIAAKATRNQINDYLIPISEGKHITTLALSEHGSGAHFYFPQTKLIKEEDHYIIDGEKTFVTNGSHADSYVVSTAAVDQHANSDQFSCAVIDSASPGMVWGPLWEGMGMRGNSSRSMNLNRVALQKEKILGSEGDQLWYVFNIIAPYFLCAMAGTYLGVAQAAFNEARDSVSRRSYSHSGTRLSQSSIIQHRLGKLYERLVSTRALIYNAAQEGDHGTKDALTLILASKISAANSAIDIANEAMTLAGGIAYGANSRLSMLLRDARAAHIMSPTTDILYTWTGRAILDQPILGD